MVQFYRLFARLLLWYPFAGGEYGSHGFPNRGLCERTALCLGTGMAGEYEVEERTMLSVQVIRNDQPLVGSTVFE
jgi:hypothetical protein